LQYLDILFLTPTEQKESSFETCNKIIAKNKEEQTARARAQLKATKLSSELISELEIPCEQDEEVAEAALSPSEAHWESTLDLDLEEESDIEYYDEDVYLSDDLELDDVVATASQAPKPIKLLLLLHHVL
jgi:hypothetical protein